VGGPAVQLRLRDIFSLFFDPAALTQTDKSGRFLLFFAVIMETAIAMVLLSRVLPYAWNRWSNIGLAVLHVAVLVFSLTAGSVTFFYAFFAAIEIATLLFVVGYAWTWREQSQLDPVALVANA
jgi:hypothetical protein